MSDNRDNDAGSHRCAVYKLAWYLTSAAVASTATAGTDARELVSPSNANPSPRILYFEESGGLLNSLAKPVPGSARPPMPALKIGQNPLNANGTVPVHTPDPPQKLAQKSRPTKSSTGSFQLRLTKSLGTTLAAIDIRTKVAETIIQPTVSEVAQPFDFIQIAERLAAERVTPEIRARKIEDAVGPETIQYRHSGVARRIGWLWLEGKEPEKAEKWFSYAKQWRQQDDEASRGLALATLAQQKYAAALSWSEELDAASPVAAQVRREAWIGLGIEAYKSDRYKAAIDAFRNVTQDANAPRYVKLLHAWSLLRSGVYQNALEKFESLYRDAPDMEAAQGIIAAAGTKAVDYEGDLKSTEPLGTLISAEQAERAFRAKQYLTARELAPQTWGALGTVGILSAAVATSRREKTGDDGLGRLTVSTTPSINVGAPVFNRGAVSVYVDQLRLDAGNLNSGATVGSAPSAATLPVGLKTHRSITESEVSLRLEREVIISATIGNVGRRLVGTRSAYGALELSANPDWGQWELKVFAKPVRESVLAWAGMIDPYSSATWGGVTRTGADFRALHLGVSPFSVGLNASVESFAGTGVLRNDRRQIGVSIGRDLGLENFAYSSLSLAYSHDAFRHNLNHYTFGHGGYFSPQQYRKAAASFDFMTKEGKSWLVRGRAEGARTSKREDSSAYFPLNPDGREYAGATSKSNESSLRLSAVTQLSPFIQAGLAISKSTSSQFSENSFQVQFRFSWERRLGVVSTDLPEPRGI